MHVLYVVCVVVCDNLDCVSDTETDDVAEVEGGRGEEYCTQRRNHH